MTCVVKISPVIGVSCIEWCCNAYCGTEGDHPSSGRPRSRQQVHPFVTLVMTLVHNPSCYRQLELEVDVPKCFICCEGVPNGMLVT